MAVSRETKDSEKFLEKSRERFKQASEAESVQRREALEDLKFATGDQWSPEIVAQRQIDGRPCLTINQLPQFIKQVTNEQRQNRPAVQINPVDDFSDIETAEVLQGIIRHIEVTSNASAAYDMAFEYAAKIGFGYFRILTDYVDDQSFDQEIQIKRISNPFSVYFDPYCEEPDFSDAQWAFIVEDMTTEDFKATYPDSELASLEDFSSIGDKVADWIGAERVRIAEYFYLETTRKTLVLLPNRTTILKDQIPEDDPRFANLPEREVEIKTVKWCKINGLEVLEERDWPGKWIPIVPVIGDEVWIDNKRILSGMVRNSKDSARMYNYWSSAETEMIALAPRAPFIGATGQFEGQESKWRDANRRNFGYLEYKPISTGGQLVGQPTRNAIEPPIQAISLARAQSLEDLKSVIGIHNPGLGVQGNETSGRAIIARQRRSDTATFNFPDNLSRSQRHAGRIMVDLIPKIYDVPRIARIIGTDDTQKNVRVVNQPEMPAKMEVENSAGVIEKIYNLGVGKYDVTVSSGPSYATKREAALDSMTQLSSAYPDLMKLAGDLVVKNMDWPGAQEIAKRIERLLPPEVRENQDQNIPPQVKAQMDTLMQQHEALTQTVETLNRQIETKQLELASKERIEAMRVQADLIQTEAKLQTQEGIALLQAEIAKIRDRLEETVFGAPINPGENTPMQ